MSAEKVSSQEPEETIIKDGIIEQAENSFEEPLVIQLFY